MIWLEWAFGQVKQTWGKEQVPECDRIAGSEWALFYTIRIAFMIPPSGNQAA